jgi:hypothetical protein
MSAAALRTAVQFDFTVGDNRDYFYATSVFNLNIGFLASTISTANL